jgi:hypothetical protein
MAKRKQLAGLGIKKPPSPPSQNSGKAIYKTTASKNKQAVARWLANKARHKGKPTIKLKTISHTASPPANKPPITLKGLQRVILASTHVTWFMGVARYYTMPTSLIGYIVRQNANFAWVYCPAQPPQLAQYYCASLTCNGLTQWGIYKYLPAPKAKKASPPASPAKQARLAQQAQKPTHKPVKRKRQAPPTQWGLGKSKPPSKPSKRKPKKA